MPASGGRAARGTARGRLIVWWAVACALLIFLAVGDEPEHTLFWEAFFDAGHVPLFGVLALAVVALRGNGSLDAGVPRNWWTAFALAVALGATTELLQFFQPSRDPSLEDFLRDVAGAGAFLLSAAVVRSVIRGGRRRVAAVAAAAILLLVSGARLATVCALYVERDRARPTLFALDGSWWERRLVHEQDSVLTPGTRPARLAPSFGEPLARLDLKPATFPGLSFEEPYPDWSAYSRLALTIVSDLDRPLTLTVRIHDAGHDNRSEDRFNRALSIQPGVNSIAIPLDDVRRAPDRREMDMRRVRGIILFGYGLKEPARVYLGALRLE